MIMETSDTIQLSFHVDTLPCSEEFYMGVGPQTDAYIVSIPENLIPESLLKIIKDNDTNKKRITGIAIVR